MSYWFVIMILTGIPLIILAYMGLVFFLEEWRNKQLREYYQKQWNKGDKDV